MGKLRRVGSRPVMVDVTVIDNAADSAPQRRWIGSTWARPGR